MDVMSALVTADSRMLYIVHKRPDSIFKHKTPDSIFKENFNLTRHV